MHQLDHKGIFNDYNFWNSPSWWNICPINGSWSIGVIYYATKVSGRIIAILAQNMATNFDVKIEPAIYAMVGAASTISGKLK